MERHREGQKNGTPLAEERGNQRPTPMPDPEVLAKPTKRRFSAAYKRSIVEKAHACTKPGELGALLRREGLYSSQLSQWRKAMREGSLTKGTKRGSRASAGRNRQRRLERECERLRKEVQGLRLMVDIQAKVAELAGLGATSGERE